MEAGTGWAGRAGAGAWVMASYLMPAGPVGDPISIGFVPSGGCFRRKTTQAGQRAPTSPRTRGEVEQAARARNHSSHEQAAPYIPAASPPVLGPSAAAAAATARFASTPLRWARYSSPA